jgi:hypothetical protein
MTYRWEDIYTTSHLKPFGYVSQKLNGKYAWYFMGTLSDRNLVFPKPVNLKAKTLRGAKTEATRYFRKQLLEILKELP